MAARSVEMWALQSAENWVCWRESKWAVRWAAEMEQNLELLLEVLMVMR